MKLPVQSEAVRYLKTPAKGRSNAFDPKVVETVSEMLLNIEKRGMDAVREYSERLDGWNPESFEWRTDNIDEVRAQVPGELADSIDAAIANVKGFAAAQLSQLTDLRVETAPGRILGHRVIPLRSVGSYAPAGRMTMIASPFMTVAVPKSAGVESVVACTPPRDGGLHIPTLYSLLASGADRIFALGGVQALAAMSFGLLTGEPVDKLVGPGNAFVAEAKRQLYGRVGIDMLAGPSEVAVIADDSADPELVAADLLAQAEHGPTSPAALVTTDEALGLAVMEQAELQIARLADHPNGALLRQAWDDFGSVILVGSDEEAVIASDTLAPEHLQVNTRRNDWYHENLRNYGSIFLGDKACVVFSDKAIGTNHVLPTGTGARYTAGLSVHAFVKCLTYQEIITAEAVDEIAHHAAVIANADQMPAHAYSSTLRIGRFA